MGHGREAVRLLTDAAPDEAAEIAASLTRMNGERQQRERAIFEEASELAEAAGMTSPDCRIIVLAQDDWHPGVIGIVCSRLAERFARPAVLLSREGERCRGSARSIEGYSIYGALESCQHLLEAFGGHEHAAGLSLLTGSMDVFARALIEHANAHIEIEQLTRTIGIDCDARLEELSRHTVQQILGFGPFGRANDPPTVRVQGVRLVEAPRPIGSHGRHLSLRIADETGASVMRAVWWNAGELAPQLAHGMRLDLAIEPKLNAWQGRVSVEAELKDVCILTGTTSPSGSGRLAERAG